MEQRVNYIELEPQKKKRRSGWKKGLIVFAILLVLFIVCGSVVVALLGHQDTDASGKQLIGDSGSISMHSPYIGELYVSGVISGGSSGGILDGDSYGYQHQWTMDRVDDMMEDSYNKGILLYVDSPGGAVYETDELYLKLREYKQKTGRPVYTYMGSEAASGGYYISAATDRIFANRNCWTGSIGVIMGPMYDVKDLLNKYGVRTVTIASGKNKGMGSTTEHMTEEQKEILQTAIDEAYDQFVGCVADGRKMDEKKVRKLADGRLYTASQAKENGLIDEIGSREETLDDMRSKYHLTGVDLTPIIYDPELGMMDKLLYSVSQIGKSKSESDLAILNKMMEESQKTEVLYMAPVQN